MPTLSFEQIDVGSTCVEVRVRVSEAALARTSAIPGLAGRALELLPGLRRHTCVNGSAHGIVAELADTETPHLLEHVAFELMALSGSPRELKGGTGWDFSADGVGVYRVRLAYDDDLVALGALKDGTEIVEWLFSPADTAAVGERRLDRPDVDAIVASLKALRR